MNGFGVVSFCLLRLEGVTLWPLPTFMGMNSTSCAYRCAVTDISGVVQEPSVYILGRSTNVPIISRLGTTLFSGEMKLIRSDIKNNQEYNEIRVSYMDGHDLFAAKVRPAGPEKTDSKLFDSVDDFVSFIKGGLSSYTPSTRAGRYSRVDLTEDSNQYLPVDATLDYSWLDDAWEDAGLKFDSAFHAGGGLYRLKYLGSTSARLQEPVIQNASSS